ncbi:MAG: aldo/keto reductase [Propionibacteriaceae bacterium]|jgi:aryl-alcohol dehydrogenase-like predicted oxidoreductase|nr:aldo/keto reductase [Propionibacteriaceae bacterium]
MSAYITLGRTKLQVFGLQLGGNPFGWTADEATSYAILDSYAGAGGNFVDTADMYSAWKEGNSGGESEQIIGRWYTSRRNRDQQIIATKVGQLPPYTTFSAANLNAACEASLRRLGTDRIDIYYLHIDDQSTPWEVSLTACDELVRGGKVLHLGASNFTPERLRAAIEFQRANGLAEFEVIQDAYNLVQRTGYEQGTMPVAVEFGLINLPYRSLASGFLSGHYRLNGDKAESAHFNQASAHLERFGSTVLPALDRLAAKYGVTPAAIGLAWLKTRPTIVVPLSGVSQVTQLAELLPAATVELSAAEAAELSALTD